MFGHVVHGDVLLMNNHSLATKNQDLQTRRSAPETLEMGTRGKFYSLPEELLTKIAGSLVEEATSTRSKYHYFDR